MLSQFPGILAIGGWSLSSSGPAYSVEFWSPAESCVLEDYPRIMRLTPTANLVAGELVACEEDSCDIFNNGEWNHFVDTRERRVFHSTAVKDDRLLLIGETQAQNGFPSTALLHSRGLLTSDTDPHIAPSRSPTR